MISPRRRYQLALLQIEQYDTRRYLDKLGNESNPDLSQRLRWTLRLRLTMILSYVFGVTIANILIGMAVSLGEQVVYNWVQRRIATLKVRGLKVIAIAGSYGKTSVKHYAYEYLRHGYRVVATPESFNTVMGIAKCLYWEVDAQTQIFIVEVGAYHIGDITHLLKMVTPDIGVLTGIARQHLERFGSFKNIQIAKREIAEYMEQTGGLLIANGRDKVVRDNVARQAVKWYGVGQERNEINIDGGRQIAKQLGVKKLLGKIRPVKNRFEMTTERYGLPVIDDSFSSNDVGFKSAIGYLGKQTKYTRILVTPGLVELGSESDKIHVELGQEIIGKADIVILVGENRRTASLARGMAGNVKVIYINKTLEFMSAVKSLKLKKEPLVLLENDVTENY